MELGDVFAGWTLVAGEVFAGGSTEAGKLPVLAGCLAGSTLAGVCIGLGSEVCVAMAGTGDCPGEGT